MSDVTPELLKQLSGMIASALREAAPITAGTSPAPPKPPAFSIQPYRASDGTTISDYFTRFTWALDLSKVPEDQHAHYARVYMGSELNDALKILVSPANPETLRYNEIQAKLTSHFEAARNKFAESIKFRGIMQEPGETIANFTLRLRQGATHCEYGTFLDRMLIEQMFGCCS